MLKQKHITCGDDLVNYNSKSDNYGKIDSNMMKDIIGILDSKYNCNNNIDIELYKWIKELYYMFENQSYENVVSFILHHEGYLSIDTQFVCTHSDKEIQMIKCTDLDHDAPPTCTQCRKTFLSARETLYQCTSDKKHILCEECCVVSTLIRLLRKNHHDFAYYMHQQLDNKNILNQMIQSMNVYYLICAKKIAKDIGNLYQIFWSVHRQDMSITCCWQTP